MVANALVIASIYFLTDPDTEEAVHDANEINYLNNITLGQIIAIVITLGIIIGFFKKVNPVMKRLTNLLDDWNGEQARPGVPKREGVMERMGQQDEVLSHLRRQVEPLVDETADFNHQEVLAKLDEIGAIVAGNDVSLHRVRLLIARHIREEKAWIALVDKATAERNFKTPPWPDLPDHHEEDDEGNLYM